MLAKSSWELSPGWRMPWGYPLCQGNSGSAQLRLQGMTSMYHINKHRGLQSIVLKTWLRFRKLTGGTVGDPGTGCKDEPRFPASHAAIVFVLPLSPLSASHSLTFVLGFMVAKGEQQLLNPCPYPAEHSMAVPSLACPAPSQLALVGLWGDSPQHEPIPSWESSACRCLGVVSTGIQKHRGVKESQRINIKACFPLGNMPVVLSKGQLGMWDTLAPLDTFRHKQTFFYVERAISIFW